jgi:putative ABC transport system ATP-binding protein
MYQLEGIVKSYSGRKELVTALKPTSLSIQPGEFVAIVGPSGSGKSTLLTMLGGMSAPTAGRVVLDEKSLYDLSAAERAKIRQQRIGFVFQSFNLVPYLTALENVQVPLMLAGASKPQQLTRATELLSRVGLADRLRHRPSELSIGQQQRVALARTLANSPAIILADEPTGNLDPATREHVLDAFSDLCRQGCTIVMVTHDPLAASRASRTITLADGAVQADSRRQMQRVA